MSTNHRTRKKLRLKLKPAPNFPATRKMPTEYIVNETAAAACSSSLLAIRDKAAELQLKLQDAVVAVMDAEREPGDKLAHAVPAIGEVTRHGQFYLQIERQVSKAERYQQRLGARTRNQE